MLVYQFAAEWLARRGVSAGYAATVLARIRHLENHVGRPDIAACFREDSVNRLLALLAETRAPSTVKGWRGDLLTIWRAAADEGFVAYPVTRRIRRVRVPETVVECFSIDEARAILGAAEGLRGGYPNGVGRRLYWSAIVRLAWDSGLRRGDCWRFGPRDFDAQLRWRVIQHKTGRLAFGRLHGSTAEAIRKAGPLAWQRHRNAFGAQFGTLVKISGVGRGTFRWLRRASGSHVELLAPGQGHRHLGHESERVFRRHYDAQIGELRRPAPPEL